MNGPHHFIRAEELLNDVERVADGDPDLAAQLVAEAHVHATLAAAAAIIHANASDRVSGNWNEALS